VEDSAQVGPGLDAMVVSRFGADASVVRCQAMAGDASTRRYVRVSLEGGSAPPSLVAMVMRDAAAARTSDEVGDTATTDEVPYVNVHRFLVECGVDVPEIYVDASDAGVLLLEDIGNTALWDAVEAAPPDEVRALFGLAIEQLLRIQIGGTVHRDERCIGFRRSFDRKLYQLEFEEFLEWGFSGRLDGELPRGELAELRRHFGDISEFLGDQPRVLNHRDFHAWNLFVQNRQDAGHDGELGNRRLRVIDFQDALLAAAPYDLATLLGDRVTPQAVVPALERQLVGDYADAWDGDPSAPWRWDPDQLWEVYCACALQKAFKVVGRFHFLDRVKGKSGYLRFLPPTLDRIRGLLAQKPEWASVWGILQEYFPELRP